jgi:NAD(P)-dependent dehydrogenase (short-subunit alcohol dehydrogenase family)
MTTATTQRQPELTGQIVVVIGGSASIGLETADRARAEGAGILIAAAELGALSRAAFDAAAADRARAVLRRPAGTEGPCDGHGRRSRGLLRPGGVR